MPAITAFRFNLPGGVRVSNADPLDADRYVVANNTVRDQLVTDGRVYEGLQIWHVADAKIYYCSHLGVDAGTTVWTQVGAGGGGSSPAFAGKNLNPLYNISGLDEQDTGLTIGSTPVGFVGVYVNGLLYPLGNGIKTLPFYFTVDNGVTARNYGSIASGDELYFNAVIAEFDMSTTDLISLLYNL